MPELNTADNILAWFKEQSEQKVPLDPLRWLEASTKLESLSGDEKDSLIELEAAAARRRVGLVEEYGTAAKARIYFEASPEYVAARRQKAKCETIQEMVQLGKHWARIKNEQMRSGL